MLEFLSTSVSTDYVSTLLGGATEVGFFTCGQFAQPQVNHIFGFAVQRFRDRDGLFVYEYFGSGDNLF